MDKSGISMEMTKPALTNPAMHNVEVSQSGDGTGFPTTLVEHKPARALIDIEQRKSRIMNIIKNWEDGPITIDDVADKPKNKKNIAKAFEALICLANKEYIKLIPNENCVLKTIEKGAKFEKYQ